jgi:parallel beta-helix repeat protein
MISGKRALNVTVTDLGIEGQSTMRCGGPYMGVAGSFGGGSLFQNIRIRHTNVGVWMLGDTSTAEGSPHDDVHWVGISVHNTFAGGIIHHRFSGVTVTSSHIRYSGDDGMAIWSGEDEATADARCTLRNNHISLNTQGSGISIYGGHDLLVTGNTIADNLYSGCGIEVCAGRFSPVPLGKVRIIGNEITRGGSQGGHGGAKDPEGVNRLCY